MFSMTTMELSTSMPMARESPLSEMMFSVMFEKYMHTSVEGFVSAYRDILKSGGGAYRTIFRYLVGLSAILNGTASRGKEKLGALIHCTAGKDRTGVFFGVLFDYLGVPREDIAREYNLTEPGLAGVREEVVSRLLQSPGFQKYMLSLAEGKNLSKEELAQLVQNRDVPDAQPAEFPPEVREAGRQAALRMVGARKESMMATLEMLDREFGGSERYLREVCGLEDEDLEKLRSVLVVRQ